MDQLEYADALGFDGLGVNEHHQNGYGLMPSPNLIAATLARRTSRAAICVIGNSIALYNPPIRVAEEFAMLDVISGGRLVAGFPGRHADGYQLLLRADPRTHPRQVRRGAQAHPARVGRTNRSRSTANTTSCAGSTAGRSPIQKPHPPIYIPGGGSIETFDFCLDYDYNYSYLSFNGYAGRQGPDG